MKRDRYGAALGRGDERYCGIGVENEEKISWGV
jgi:hypothetical protein